MIGQMKEECIAYLKERGYQQDKDFMEEEMFDLADGLAFDEEVDKRVRELKGGYIFFDGDDECVNCRGWNGKSRRCDCGNRRVNWAWDDHGTFLHPILYAEAY
jgi:hypothetical protein